MRNSGAQHALHAALSLICSSCMARSSSSLQAAAVACSGSLVLMPCVVGPLLCSFERWHGLAIVQDLPHCMQQWLRSSLAQNQQATTLIELNACTPLFFLLLVLGLFWHIELLCAIRPARHACVLQAGKVPVPRPLCMCTASVLQIICASRAHQDIWHDAFLAHLSILSSAKVVIVFITCHSSPVCVWLHVSCKQARCRCLALCACAATHLCLARPST
jgi:hypothetical protein